MNPSVRKKKPPDPLLSSFDLSITSNLLVDLAMSLLLHRVPFPAIPFPWPLLDPTLLSATRFYQIDSRVQSTTRRFWSQSESATILDIFWVPNLSGYCDETSGSNPGRVSASQLGSAILILGPRSAIAERRCHDWKTYSVSLRLGCFSVPRQPQVCSFHPYLLRLV